LFGFNKILFLKCFTKNIILYTKQTSAVR
jgi:hypothetical protein